MSVQTNALLVHMNKAVLAIMLSMHITKYNAVVSWYSDCLRPHAFGVYSEML